MLWWSSYGNIYVCQIDALYILKLCNIICQLYLNKTEKTPQNKKKQNPPLSRHK